MSSMRCWIVTGCEYPDTSVNVTGLKVSGVARVYHSAVVSDYTHARQPHPCTVDDLRVGHRGRYLASVTDNNKTTWSEYRHPAVAWQTYRLDT